MRHWGKTWKPGGVRFEGMGEWNIGSDMASGVIGDEGNEF